MSRLLKNITTTALAMLSGFALSGCSNLFGSGPDTNKPLVIQKESVACLKSAGDDLNAYAEDGSGDIGRIIDCTVQAIDDFTSDTQGAKNQAGYTRLELANFIDQYLTAADSKAAGDSPAYTDQGLNLKQLIMGGSSETISRTEIAKIKSLLLRAKPILIELGPNLKVALLKSDKASHQQVERAKAGINKLVELLVSELERAAPGRPDWTIADIISALNRLDFKLTVVESWLPIAKVAKTILVGGDEENIRPKDWSTLLRTASKAFGLALQVKYEVSSNPDWLGSGLPGLETAIADGLSLLDQGIAANGGAIEGKTLRRLIDVISKKGVLPATIQGLQPDTAKNLLPIILGKALCGNFSDDCLKNKSTDLNAVHVGRIRALAFDWLAGQKTINKAFAKRAAIPVEEVGKALASNVILANQFKDPKAYNYSLRAQAQLLSFFDKGRPPITDKHGRLLVMNKKDLRDITKKDLDNINGLRVVVLAVLQGWTKNQVNAQSLTGLTEAETQEVYLDLTPLGADLKWMDTRNTQAGVRTFMETSIFMSSSNNDGFLNIQEGVEWFSFVMSGGTLADKIYEREFQPECGLPISDILGRKKIDAVCFRKKFLKVWAGYLTNLPHLVTWVRQDGSGERARLMLQALETAARNKGLTDDPVDSSEFRSMIPIAQYLESLFARFDQNKNAILDHDEVWSTFPLLQPFIKQMGKGSADSDEIQRTVLSYILQYGECPEPKLIDKAWVAYWVVARRFQSDEADRIQVLKVIGSFGIANRKDRARNIEAFYEENKNSLRKLLATGAATDASAAAKITGLFQCQPAAVPILADLMKRPGNLDKLVPAAGPTKVAPFMARVKYLTENNETLQRLCLPF